MFARTRLFPFCLLSACSADAPGPGVTASSGPYFNEPMFFNQDISGEAKAANSDQIIGSLRAAGGWGNSDRFTIDFTFPEPDPPPVTTIAWRLGHVIVGVLGARNASHFGGPPIGYEDFVYADSADTALQQLDSGYAAWQAGVESLGDAGLDRPVGEAEGPWADAPYSVLVLHINREMIHHLAEVCLLRDLYLHREQAGRS